jgi:hypothetical protein
MPCKLTLTRTPFPHLFHVMYDYPHISLALSLSLSLSLSLVLWSTPLRHGAPQLPPHSRALSPRYNVRAFLMVACDGLKSPRSSWSWLWGGVERAGSTAQSTLAW